MRAWWGGAKSDVSTIVVPIRMTLYPRYVGTATFHYSYSYLESRPADPWYGGFQVVGASIPDKDRFPTVIWDKNLGGDDVPTANEAYFPGTWEIEKRHMFPDDPGACDLFVSDAGTIVEPSHKTIHVAVKSNSRWCIVRPKVAIRRWVQAAKDADADAGRPDQAAGIAPWSVYVEAFIAPPTRDLYYGTPVIVDLPASTRHITITGTTLEGRPFRLSYPSTGALQSDVFESAISRPGGRAWNQYEFMVKRPVPLDPATSSE